MSCILTCLLLLSTLSLGLINEMRRETIGFTYGDGIYVSMMIIWLVLFMYDEKTRSWNRYGIPLKEGRQSLPSSWEIFLFSRAKNFGKAEFLLLTIMNPTVVNVFKELYLFLFVGLLVNVFCFFYLVRQGLLYCKLPDDEKMSTQVLCSPEKPCRVGTCSATTDCKRRAPHYNNNDNI